VIVDIVKKSIINILTKVIPYFYRSTYKLVSGKHANDYHYFQIILKTKGLLLQHSWAEPQSIQYIIIGT